MNRCLESLDTTRPRHTSEAGSKFGIVISNEIFRCLPIRRGFSQLVRRPSVGGSSCHADMDHPSRLQFDDEEGKEWPKEKVSHRKARHRPRCSPRDCAETCSTFDLVEA